MIKKENMTTPNIKSRIKYFVDTLPTNIIKKEVKKRSSALDKSAGAIRPQTMIMGKIIGINALLKSLIISCLADMAYQSFER
jgi:hypothetical protein